MICQDKNKAGKEMVVQAMFDVIYQLGREEGVREDVLRCHELALLEVMRSAARRPRLRIVGK